MDNGKQEIKKSVFLIVSTTSIAYLFICYLFIISYWGKVTDYLSNINYRNIRYLITYFICSFMLFCLKFLWGCVVVELTSTISVRFPLL
jgi:hypothetical protein